MSDENPTDETEIEPAPETEPRPEPPPTWREGGLQDHFVTQEFKPKSDE
jgi:hypothetical protein